MEHVKPELMEIGLEAMHALLEILSTEPQTATIFYQNFFLMVLKSALTVMTDYQHMSGFKLQGMIMQQLVKAVDRTDLIDPNTRLLNAQS